ncbi:MAG TPA: molybdopterin-synthase adenylyltransferase MoeB [Myxococcota bacterium]|nr:molybdopterin-synthase adenylyltransferase MoeB [Myxococcota bacterium]
MASGAPPFRPEQYERYRRHLNLGEIGPEGQLAWLRARVAVVGAGGLGCPAALYLAAAGVGTLGLFDADVVELSNLQRQVLYGTGDVGRPKVEVARERLAALNPDVRLETHALRLRSDNALEALRGYDVIVDGSDNFPTRYLVSDAGVLLGTPVISGAILRFEGQVSVFDARRGPCYRCLFPEPPPPGAAPSCAEAGVLGVLPGLVALVQATETLKLLAGVGEPLLGRLLQLDALEMRFGEFQFGKDPACPACGEHATLRELVDYDGFCGVPAREEAPLVELAPAEVARRGVPGRDYLLLDVREPDEHAKARLEGARLVPLGELPARVEELAGWRERPVVVHCHKGGRSAKACRLLRDAGFLDVANLAGGIEAWSLSVDPTVPRY